MEGDVDFLREGLKVLAEALIDAEVSHHIDAERFERSGNRKNDRNGYRNKEWDTRVGTIGLKIPKLRKGSDFPSLLEPRRRAEKALLSVVQKAYFMASVQEKPMNRLNPWASTGPAKARFPGSAKDGMRSFKHSSRIALRRGEYPYIWLEAAFLKVREGGRVHTMAFVIAIGVKNTCEREVLGFDLGTSDDGAFWLAFLRSLAARGLRGVKLSIRDAHEGLRAAIETVWVGSAWQRCRVRDVQYFKPVPKSSQMMVSAIVHTIFAQPTQAAAKQQLSLVVRQLEERFPKAMEVLKQAEEDVLVYMAFPREHWKPICRVFPLERLNRERFAAESKGLVYSLT